MSKGGRPRLPDNEVKKKNLTFRSRGNLLNRIKDAAAANNRSISAEIEARLIESFAASDIRETVRRAVRDEFAQQALPVLNDDLGYHF